MSELDGKTLILIPCCKKKEKGGIPEYKKENCILNDLSPEKGKKLMELRREVAKRFVKDLGPDLGESTRAQIEYMEAYKRYGRGHLYREITSWEKLNRSQNLKLVIVSAFYGVSGTTSLSGITIYVWGEKSMENR